MYTVYISTDTNVEMYIYIYIHIYIADIYTYQPRGSSAPLHPTPCTRFASVRINKIDRQT